MAVASAQALNNEQESIEQYASRMGTRVAIPLGLVVGLLVILLNTDRTPVPMLDDLRAFGVIGFLAMIPISALTAGWGFVLGVRAWNERVAADRQRKWGLAVVPVALAYMLFTTAILAVILTLVEYAFQDLQLISIQGALIAGGGVAAFTMWIVNDVMKLNAGRLLLLVVVILGGGIYLAITSIEDPLWWRVSFSYLGKLESNVNFIFNFTLVFAGILLLVWLGYFMSDFRILVRHGIAAERWAKWVRIALIWLAIAIMLVGIFKSNLTPFDSLVHNLAAYSLAVIFGLLMASGRWTVPGFPPEFHSLSWIVVVLLVGTLIWSALGYVNTVGLEFVAFVLGLMWLSQFASNTENLAEELEPEAFPN